eukprot:scaffold69224_cov36-Prasinocladus_malaysianus.AAC.2
MSDQPYLPVNSYVLRRVYLFRVARWIAEPLRQASALSAELYVIFASLATLAGVAQPLVCRRIRVVESQGSGGDVAYWSSGQAPL